MTHVLLRRRRAARRSDSGSAVVEFALLVPALVIMLGLLVGGGRLWFARTTVNEASHTAARAASLSRSAAQAGAEGRAAATQSLATGGLKCTNQSTSVDTSGFSVPVGSAATITSTVRCSVPFADVLLPGMPGTITLEGSGSSALDAYRSRNP